MSWLLLYTTAFPRVQERIHAELDDVIGNGRKVELKDKSELVYTNAVILEVMRIVSPLPFAVPHYAITDSKIEGFYVDQDTVIIFHLYSMHHDQQFWGDPENFRPERLILENNTLDADKCNHIMPFGIGRRRCVGELFAKMNIFITFSTIMQKCKLFKPIGVELDLRPTPGLVYSPKDYQILAEERK